MPVGAGGRGRDAELHESIGEIEAEWEGLAAEVAASPFAYPGWIRAWWDAFGRGAFATVAVRRGSRLVALLPLQRGRATLRSASNWHSTSSGLLALDADAAERLGSALLALAPRSVVLAFLDPAQPGLAECEGIARAAGYRILSRTLERSPAIAIEGGWPEFESTRSRNLRADVGRRLRRLQEAGALELQVVDGSEGLDELLEEGFRVEASGWKGVRGTAIVSSPETRRFYEDTARWASGRGWLRLAFLRLDGVPIAFQYNLVAEGVHYHLKGGYDESFERFSPGKVLHRLLIERAFADGLRRYEFLGADEQYKLQWANTARDLVLLQAFRASPGGSAEWLAYAVGRPVAKRVVAAAASVRSALGQG